MAKSPVLAILHESIIVSTTAIRNRDKKTDGEVVVVTALFCFVSLETALSIMK